MSNTPAEQIVWIDCEMTGLDIDTDGLCEIAVIVTDFELNVLDAGFDAVIHPGEETLAQMGDFVRKMHDTSGLLSRIREGVSVEEAEAQVLEYLARFVTKGRRPLVAGNTIGMDRRFIAKYMPTLEQALHYRSIDVSTIKELSRRWYPAVFFESPVKNGGHRALADITESIRELAYFRRAVMVEGPGPDKAAASQLSAEATDQFAPLMGAAPGAAHPETDTPQTSHGVTEQSVGSS